MLHLSKRARREIGLAAFAIGVSLLLLLALIIAAELGFDAIPSIEEGHLDEGPW
jgi:hypothetical protein